MKYNKKIKALWIILDCRLTDYDFIVIRMKSNDNIYNLFIEKKSNEFNDFINNTLNNYNDDLIFEKSKTEILSVCGAYNENSLDAINAALDANSLYILDPYTE